MLDLHLLGRQELCELHEPPTGYDDRTGALDLSRDGRAQRELHIRRRELQVVAGGAKQDSREDLHRGTRRDRARDHRETLDEVVPPDCDLHPCPHWCFSFNHLKEPRSSNRQCGRRGRQCARGIAAASGTCTGSGDKSRFSTCPTGYRTCFTRAVSSCTRLYTDLSSRIRRAIFEVAWMTVVWSRPPNSLPIFGSDESVSSRERYIATWRG